MKKQIIFNSSLFLLSVCGLSFLVFWFSPSLMAEDVGVTTSITGSSSGEPTSPDPITVIKEVKVFPEKRVNADQNKDTEFYFSLHDPATHDLLWKSDLVESNSEGIYQIPIELEGLSLGEYDIVIKSKSHLSQRLDNVPISSGENTLNFTNAVNSADQDGDQRLFAGDINGLGIDNQSLGDDEVNAIDLSILLEDLNKADPTGNQFRSNLNQDSVVDQNDLIILLSNIDRRGGSFNP